MLQPANTKHRKQFKGRIHGHAKGNYELTFGFYGLKALEPERISSRQIEAALGELYQDTLKEQEDFGLEYSLMFQLLQNQLKLEWVRVKVILTDGLYVLSLVQ